MHLLTPPTHKARLCLQHFFVRNLFLTLDPGSVTMPARKRKTRTTEEAETDPKRQRAWMLEQKKKEEEEAAEAEKQADKESENDSGREEGDGPLEDWAKRELADECKTLGLCCRRDSSCGGC